MGFKLPRWLTPPKTLNSVSDLAKQSAGLTELLGELREWDKLPTDPGRIAALRNLLNRLGVL